MTPETPRRDEGEVVKKKTKKKKKPLSQELQPQREPDLERWLPRKEDGAEVPAWTDPEGPEEGYKDFGLKVLPVRVRRTIFWQGSPPLRRNLLRLVLKPEVLGPAR